MSKIRMQKTTGKFYFLLSFKDKSFIRFEQIMIVKRKIYMN